MFTTSTRRVVTSFAPIVRRNMSHGASNAAEEVSRWKKLSYVMVAISTTMALYNIAVHEHEHARHDLPYQHIRSKPYPWKCPDCNLFDGDCWKACKSGAAAAEH